MGWCSGRVGPALHAWLALPTIFRTSFCLVCLIFFRIFKANKGGLVGGSVGGSVGVWMGRGRGGGGGGLGGWIKCS